MKKAQMSLEMIIGLLILLVVAVVVINIFLTQMKKTDTFNSFDETLEYDKYKSDCESYCNQFINTGELAYGVQFCTKRLFEEGSTKLMKKGIVDKIELSQQFPITKGYPVCEDAIYCFHVMKCESIDWGDCAQVLCRYYYDTYKDRQDINDPWDIADKKVKEIMPNAGSCTLPQGENWWEIYFGPKACTSPGQSSGGKLSLGTCTVNLNWYFECDDISEIGTCQRGLVAVEDSTGSEGNAGNIGMGLYGVEGGTIQINTSSGKLTGTFVVDQNKPLQDCHEIKFWCDSDWDGTSVETLNPEYEASASSCTLS